MKILIICHKNIFNPLDGGSLASKKIFSDLKKNYNTKVICLTNQKNKSNEENITFQIKKTFSFNKLIKSFFSNKSYQAERFFSKNICNKIIDIINKNQYEYILFEGVFPAVYLEEIKKKCNCKTIIRTHNIEHEIWQGLQHNTRNIYKKFIYLFIKKQIKKWEDYICMKSDFICCISKNDIQYFSEKINKKIKLLPVSFSVKKNKKNDKFSIFHLGSMDWRPNIEGVNWFIDKVWSKFTEKDIDCYLAGKNMPDDIKNKNSRKLIIEGTVDNSTKYMYNKSVMIVPIFSGSGIRIKILEGMALGIPIISTSKGAKGIDYKNGENILIADDEISFYNAIIKLYSDPILFEKISNGGRKLIKHKFSSEIVIEKWNNLIQS